MEDIVQRKCKNCGAALDARGAENGVVTCDFCYSAFTLAKKQTTPKALEFLNMGEHELDVCNFDGAYKAYRKAAEECSDEPEAYWGMALSSARVQYLRDIVNNRLQPVCHETSPKRFTDDENYRKALSLATSEQREEYEKKAEEIEVIHGEFRKLEESGLAYDCFICVKVTDGNRHTEDSVMALSLYHKLKAAGFKPFYSEEEMAGRTGADYEALILYALHVSKCMLLICTEERYLKTPWVENEYTRFVGMMHDEEKSKGSIAIVFGEKPIERIPGLHGKIQGVKFNSFDALDRIQTFVRGFVEEDTEKRLREEEAKKREEELRRQLDEMRRQMDELKKGAEKPSPKPDSKFYKCKTCGAQLDSLDAVNGVITCKLCGDKYEINPAPAPKPEFEFEKNETGYTLKKYHGQKHECVIPSEYNGEKVTKIGQEAFRANKPLARVIIPDSITLIGGGAFIDCSSLTYVMIGSGVTSIEVGAFWGCEKLKSIKLPQRITSIGEGAFSDCVELATINLPENVVTIGGGAFKHCVSLTDIDIPKGLTTIENETFNGCCALTKVIIPDNITSIGDFAFFGCTELTNIIIPNNVKSIGSNAFHDCWELTSVTISEGVTIIGEGAFESCDKLSEVIFKKPQGWSVGLFGSAKALSNPEKAAKLLKKSTNLWTRK